MASSHAAESSTQPVGPRLTPDDRRRHLLGIARAMVEARGTAALSMDAVAQEAGVSRALLYTYFDNRSGLLQALWVDRGIIEEVFFLNARTTLDRLREQADESRQAFRRDGPDRGRRRC